MRSRVVIVGGGHAGFELAAALRARGYDAEVTLVCGEPDAPYQRPPLSKGYLQGSHDDETIRFRSASFYGERQIDLRCGAAVMAIDRETSAITLDGGERIHYDHLVLATGARPRELPVEGTRLEGVTRLRGIADARELAARLSGTRRLVVVGGGFLGLEVAAVAGAAGVDTTIVEALPGLMARAVSKELSAFYARTHETWGADVRCGSAVGCLHGQDGAVSAVELVDGTSVQCDLVLVAVGAAPEVELAAAAGLDVDDGVVVDALLRTSDPAISAIGDCARYPSVHAGRRVRLESVQNAADQARCVAARLTGDPAPYAALPWFWSYQRSVKLQLAGLKPDDGFAVVRGEPSEGTFSVFWFDQHDRLAAVEAVNRPADHMAARRLLASDAPVLTPAVAADQDFDLLAHARAITLAH